MKMKINLYSHFSYFRCNYIFSTPRKTYFASAKAYVPFTVMLQHFCQVGYFMFAVKISHYSAAKQQAYLIILWAVEGHLPAHR